jgi:Holliday junction resolvasome RuvABC endonuclease subunit
LSGKRVPARPPERIGSESEALRVLALDISSVCVGWSLFDDGAPSAHGKYLQQGEGHGEKLANFAEWLADTIFESQSDYVVIEKPYPGRNKNAYKVLTMYIGRVLESFWSLMGVELPDESFIPPQTVKAILSFPKGEDHEANKRIAVTEINRLYGLALKYDRKDRKKTISDDDTADAIALNLAWHLKNKPELIKGR